MFRTLCLKNWNYSRPLTFLFAIRPLSIELFSGNFKRYQSSMSDFLDWPSAHSDSDSFGSLSDSAFEKLENQKSRKTRVGSGQFLSKKKPLPEASFGSSEFGDTLNDEELLQLISEANELKSEIKELNSSPGYVVNDLADSQNILIDLTCADLDKENTYTGSKNQPSSKMVENFIGTRYKKSPEREKKDALWKSSRSSSQQSLQKLNLNKRSLFSDEVDDQLWEKTVQENKERIQKQYFSKSSVLEESFGSPIPVRARRQKAPKIEESSASISMTQHLIEETGGASVTFSPRRQYSTVAAQPATKYATQFTLSDEQQKVLEIIKQGHNIFYTGSAGAGKSVLLTHAIKELRKLHKGEVHVTASTGLASCNIGGTTLHSFAGVGLGDGLEEQLLKRVRKVRKSLNKWKSAKVLIIDEISMIDATLLDKLNFIAKSIRKNDLPFGGIQVIFCGDFYQLPPVTKAKFSAKNSTEDETPKMKFAFESNAWKESIKIQVLLTKVFRQEGDLEFIGMLNEMRNGTLCEKTIQKFRSLSRELPKDDGIDPAELFSTRYEVANANKRRLRQIKEQEHVFKSMDGGTLVSEEQRLKLLANFLAPEELKLKKGAQVMMIKNIDEKLVNGSLGKILDFIDPDTYCFYNQISKDPDNPDFERDVKKKLQSHLTAKGKEPLLINPSQIETLSQLDETIFDFFAEYEKDDTLHEIELENLNRKKGIINDLYSSSKRNRYPLVRFLTSDGSTRDILVCPETWNVEDEWENPLVSRTQIPLILAWAISIHKSQGQTLPKLEVDLKRVFEKGQAYVAISRVTSRHGLRVLNFTPEKVMTHFSVREFYTTLSSADEALAKADELQNSAAFISKKLFGNREPPKVRQKQKPLSFKNTKQKKNQLEFKM